MKVADVFGSENRFLLGCWIGALALILGLGFYLGSDTVSIQGVAESREFQVNFDSPVEIKKIYVMPNQEVHRGDLLMELGQSEWASQLRVLKAKLERLRAEMKLRKEISALAKDTVMLSPEADPLLADLEDTRREISLIEKRLENLFVFAEIDGAVGAVNFKNGEKAPSFSPIVTLVPINPTYVSAYVNEQLRNTIEVGQYVNVATSGGHAVIGKVVSVGTRIVQIPERLLRIQTLPAWGREVLIRIPAKNSFLLGEKVSIQKRWSLSLMSQAQAEAHSLVEVSSISPPKEIDIPEQIQEFYKPEMSGLVFIPELRQFALIADDYPKSRPVIFLMTDEGRVQERVLPVDHIQEMDDIESISLAGDHLYLMSSLSKTRKGKQKATRQMFAKVRRQGLTMKAEAVIDLRRILFEMMEKSTDPMIKDILANEDLGDGFEVEGHVVRGDELLLTLKGPILEKNQTAMLRVKSLEALFNNQWRSEDLQLEGVIDFTLPHRTAEVLATDMMIDAGVIYVATSCRAQPCSGIWKVHPETSKAELIHEFKQNHLEGIAIHPQTRRIYGVFDLKSGSQFAIIPSPVSLQGAQ